MGDLVREACRYILPTVTRRVVPHSSIHMNSTQVSNSFNRDKDIGLLLKLRYPLVSYTSDMIGIQQDYTTYYWRILTLRMLWTWCQCNTTLSSWHFSHFGPIFYDAHVYNALYIHKMCFKQLSVARYNCKHPHISIMCYKNNHYTL